MNYLGINYFYNTNYFLFIKLDIFLIKIKLNFLKLFYNTISNKFICKIYKIRLFIKNKHCYKLF